MKRILILFAFFYLLVSFQLNKETFGKFEYEQIETRTKGFRSHVMFFDLNISKNFSTYTQVYKQELDEKYSESNKDGVSNIIIVKQKKSEMEIVYNDFENNTYFKDLVTYDNVYVKEDKFNLEWKLSEETKNYGKRECKKATTFFRGRTYIAWYLPDIKTKVGPWKFKNPPGLIFEIYDIDYVLHIKLNKFNTKSQSNINSWDLEKNKKIISLKDYIKLKLKAEDVLLERLNSKLSKGSAPFVKNTEQKDIEIFN